MLVLALHMQLALGAHVGVQLALMLALHVQVLEPMLLFLHRGMLPADRLPRPLIVLWRGLLTPLHTLQGLRNLEPDTGAMIRSSASLHSTSYLVKWSHAPCFLLQGNRDLS